MIFQYTRYKTFDGHLESLPLLSVELKHKGQSQKVWALVDSGADISLFNAEIAALLGITPDTGHPDMLGGIAGDDIKIWLHPVELTVVGFPSIAINVAFTDTLTPDVMILGQKGFFDNFQIRFQRYKDQFEIYPKGTGV